LNDLRLVDGWADPVVIFARHDNLGDFEGSEIAQTKLHELTPKTLSVSFFLISIDSYVLFMQLVNGF
jgi:hypothetical protein